MKERYRVGSAIKNCVGIKHSLIKGRGRKKKRHKQEKNEKEATRETRTHQEIRFKHYFVFTLSVYIIAR